MVANPQKLSRNHRSGKLSPAALAAIADLQQAHAYARQLGCDRWEFAVELEHLVARGATVSDLRFLAINGYVDHSREISRPGDPARCYEAGQNLAFDRQTCFIATEAGLKISASSGSYEIVARPDAGNLPTSIEPVASPRWDAIARTLTIGGQIVKCYRVPSPNQQAILAAFEEEGWPRSIDDPLPYSPGRRAKERLHATIRCLNANQANRLLRFRGDGTGERILWETVAGSASNSRSNLPVLRRAA
jgi:hypothetical protein